MPGMDGFISFNGTLNGSIEGGSGGDVADVKVRHSQTTEYESVVNDEKIALIDLVSYVRRNELAQELQTQEYNFDLKLDLKQNNLIAGENITIENNVISSSGGSAINYSYDEQPTGQKWVDGKDIYLRTYDISTTSSQNIFTVDNASEFLPMTNYKAYQADGTSIIGGWFVSTSDYLRMFTRNNSIYIQMGNNTYRNYTRVVVNVYYTKTEE